MLMQSEGKWRKNLLNERKKNSIAQFCTFKRNKSKCTWNIDYTASDNKLQSVMYTWQ